jgi:hypothetical protein
MDRVGGAAAHVAAKRTVTRSPCTKVDADAVTSVMVQANVRHIVTGFFLGAGASKAADEADARPTNWQATQHSNRYRVRQLASNVRGSPALLG